MEDKKYKINEKLKEIFKSDTDPDGWYTGVTTTDEYSEPVQDADDL